MAEITATQIKDLRERTGAGMADCKKALVEVNGDADKAIDWLRAKGLSKAAKKAGREATEGAVVSYIHGGGRIGVLVEIGCETDFVANTPGFREFAHEVALQISALPETRWVRREDVPAELVQAEVEIYKAQAADKPEQVQQKIAEGKLGKWFEGVVLLEQPWIRDNDKTIEQLRADLSITTGENVEIKRFARFERGA
jgi:elongation factor Ts